MAGLAAVALADAASFALVLVVLLVLRLPGTPTGTPAPAPPGLARSALDGLRVVLADRPLRLCLLLLSAAALALLPASSLLLPLLGRGRGWTAGQTGAVVGAVALGAALVAVTVLASRPSSRPGAAAAAGLLLAAAGLAGLCLPLSPAAGTALGAVVGVGTGVFTTHVGPLFLTRGPATHLSRVQAVVGLAQSLPLLAGAPLLGTLAHQAGAAVALGSCAAALAAAAGAALASPALRDAR